MIVNTQKPDKFQAKEVSTYMTSALTPNLVLQPPPTPLLPLFFFKLIYLLIYLKSRAIEIEGMGGAELPGIGSLSKGPGLC